MDFERNYPVRIPSNQLNNLRSYSTASSRVANNKIGGYLLKPSFVTGFTDAEGCFFVSVRESPNSKLKEAVSLRFVLTQHLLNPRRL